MCGSLGVPTWQGDGGISLKVVTIDPSSRAAREQFRVQLSILTIPFYPYFWKTKTQAAEMHRVNSFRAAVSWGQSEQLGLTLRMRHTHTHRLLAMGGDELTDGSRAASQIRRVEACPRMPSHARDGW